MPGERAPPATAPGQLRVNDLRGLLPPGGGNQQTAVFGVVGGSLAHSFSPHVHGMALKMARLDALYLAFETEDLKRFLELADDELFRGFSVTAPHKQAAFAVARERDEASHACHASNTLVRERQGWRALNTDVPAVRETLETAYRFHCQKSGKAQIAQGGPLLGRAVSCSARVARRERWCSL
jgi:3-dehydroquinate dehydratase/shikimate dehydrogenase